MKFIYLFILLFFISCASANKVKSGIYIDGTYKNSEVKYHVGELEEKWKLLDIERVNLGFYNIENNAIIYVNSKCKKSSDAPLYVLRTHLLIGFKGKKFQESKKIIYQKREALDSTLIASLDGVKRKIRYLVFKKDGCLYDLVLISPIKYFKENNVDFSKIIKNFKIIKGSNIKVFLED